METIIHGLGLLLGFSVFVLLLSAVGNAMPKHLVGRAHEVEGNKNITSGGGPTLIQREDGKWEDSDGKVYTKTSFKWNGSKFVEVDWSDV